MNKKLQQIIKSGGEGLILRSPQSMYTAGRSESFYKFKATRDHEGLVLSVNLSESSCTTLLPNSQVIDIPLTAHFENSQQLKYGDIITFSFSNLSPNGIPFSAQIERIRTDVTWEEIAHNRSHYAHDENLKSETRPKREPGFWSNPESTNMRRFFEEFSVKMKFASPEAWYHVKNEDVIREGGASVLLHYNGSLIRALLDLFPALGLEESKFSRNYWLSKSNRKVFFEQLAQKYQFDPHSAENWYSVPHATVKTEKGGAAVLHYYGNSLAKALCDLFPDIGLQPQRFATRDYRNSRERVREFFVEYAAEHGFDPLQASNWNQITTQPIKMCKGGSTVVQKYKSVRDALIDSFPEIHFDDMAANTFKELNWHEAENRILYFNHYAKRHALDPLQHESWSEHAFTADKRGRYILGFYGGSLRAALADIYKSDLHSNAAHIT